MEREYDYRPGWGIILFGAVFFGAGAMVLGSVAYRNDRGLILDGVIELPTGYATAFYWSVTVCSVAFVVAAAVLAGTRLTFHQRIAYTDTCLMIPRSRWSGEEVAVPFGDVLDYATSEAYGQRMLTIVYRGGKFTIAASMLPSNEAFDDISRVVAQRCTPGGLTNRSVDRRGRVSRPTRRPQGPTEHLP